MKRREKHWGRLDLEMPLSIYNNIIRTFFIFFPFYLPVHLSSLVCCVLDTQVDPGSTKTHTHQCKDKCERQELLSIYREKGIECLICISGSGLSLSSPLV